MTSALVPEDIGPVVELPQPVAVGRMHHEVVGHHHPAAVRLLRAMVERGPDLFLADGNETSRKLCQALGGTVVEARSGRWLRILRPAGLASTLLEGGSSHRP